MTKWEYYSMAAVLFSIVRGNPNWCWQFAGLSNWKQKSETPKWVGVPSSLSLYRVDGNVVLKWSWPLCFTFSCETHSMTSRSNSSREVSGGRQSLVSHVTWPSYMRCRHVWRSDSNSGDMLKCPNMPSQNGNTCSLSRYASTVMKRRGGVLNWSYISTTDLTVESVSRDTSCSLFQFDS